MTGDRRRHGHRRRVPPDNAGQLVLGETYDGTLGPGPGLAVTASWTGAALRAGAWSVRGGDA
ncbi:hypothetical protein ACFZDB_19910 [Streptomyces luteogriseus]|uniref:hypothetical protein n=1 Tax=Streptomyces luteogriseus TaxID=68233 RepID=UPI0036EE09F3